MLKIGDVEVHRIEEIMLHETTNLFAEWHEDIRAEHPELFGPNYYDAVADGFVTSIHSWLLKMPGRTVVIDTCGGNGKDRAASPRFDRLDTPWLARLAIAGVKPADVDTVINTHLHVDHVGWNTRPVDGRWVPTFANATYVFSRIEDEWRDPARGGASKPPAAAQPYMDSVRPVIEAGQARIVEGAEEVVTGLDLMPVPGHAPGQMAVRLRSGGQEALFIGDVMHQPIQVYHPDWSSRYCEDPELAVQTRARILAYCADTGCLMLPAHFGTPHCGYVSRAGDGFALRFVDGTP